jgi:hypothetical protein
MQRSDSAPVRSENRLGRFNVLLRDFDDLRDAHAAIQRAPFDRNEHEAHRVLLRALSSDRVMKVVERVCGAPE